jgi:hypothetical protein
MTWPAGGPRPPHYHHGSSHRDGVTVPAAVPARATGRRAAPAARSRSPSWTSGRVMRAGPIVIFHNGANTRDSCIGTGRTEAAVLATGNVVTGPPDSNNRLIMGPGDACRTDRDLSQWNLHTRLMYRNQLCLQLSL